MTRIQIRRDTLANWTSRNPIPASGEPCYETDTRKFKIGDGSTAYLSLPYQGDSGASYSFTNPLVDTDGVVTLNYDNETIVLNADGKLACNLDELGNEVNSLSSSVNALSTTVAGKQDALTAGENITIENNIISAASGGVAVVSLTQSNFNNVITPGVYYWSGYTTSSNNPSGNSKGYLVVYTLTGATATISQEFTIAESSTSVTQKRWLRFCVSNGSGYSWSNWVELLQTSSLSEIQQEVVDTQGDVASLDADVVNLKAAVGDVKFVTITQTDYDGLASKDANTLYIING